MDQELQEPGEIVIRTVLALHMDAVRIIIERWLNSIVLADGAPVISVTCSKEVGLWTYTAHLSGMAITLPSTKLHEVIQWTIRGFKVSEDLPMDVVEEVINVVDYNGYIAPGVDAVVYVTLANMKVETEEGENQPCG